MPTVFISPVLNDEQLDNDGLPLTGGLIYAYVAGTSTLATTYTTKYGNVAQTNPIVLNARGEVDSLIWLATGNTYDFYLFDTLGNKLRQYSNISGVNDIAAALTVPSEWILSTASPSYINGTQFSMAGDQTQLFTKYRRTLTKISAGYAYGTITSSVYAAGVTTVTQVNDSTILDSGISTVWYGFNTLQSAPGIIQSGTVMPFYQAAAPLGFTQVTTRNNYMMRIVSTAGGGFGGTDSPILMDKVPSHVHTFTTGTENQPHHHTYTSPNAPSGLFAGATSAVVQNTTAGVSTSDNSVPHTHAGTSDFNTGFANWVPKYLDFIIASKD